MTESELKVFVDIIQHYFAQQTGRPAEMGTPYLGDPHGLPVFDYTGVIGVSGNRTGCVYFTAPTAMLEALLLRAGDTDLSPDNLADLAGEIGNTMSGNARREFGNEFQISVPVVVRAREQSITLPRSVKAYVIPFHWHKLEASLVVSIV